MLTLPIKEPWFSMIKRGEKLEEYRDYTPYYLSRFGKYLTKPVAVKFRNGYNANSPSFEKTVIPRIRKGGNPQWGAEPEKTYFVLQIQPDNEVAP